MEYTGKGGMTRFVRMADTGSCGTRRVDVEGRVGRGRSERAFDKRLCPRCFSGSTGNWGATSGERMVESGRAGAGAGMSVDREMKPS